MNNVYGHISASRVPGCSPASSSQFDYLYLYNAFVTRSFHATPDKCQWIHYIQFLPAPPERSLIGSNGLERALEKEEQEAERCSICHLLPLSPVLIAGKAQCRDHVRHGDTNGNASDVPFDVPFWDTWCDSRLVQCSLCDRLCRLGQNGLKLLCHLQEECTFMCPKECGARVRFGEWAVHATRCRPMMLCPYAKLLQTHPAVAGRQLREDVSAMLRVLPRCSWTGAASEMSDHLRTTDCRVHMKMASVVLSSYAVSHADDPISAPESVGLLARSSGTSNATIDYSHMEIASEPNGQQHDLLSLRDDDAADMHSQSEQPIADQGVVTDAALMDAASNARYSAGSPRANGSTRMLYCYFKQLHPLRCLIHQSRWYLRLSDLKRCQQWSVNRLSIAISSLPLCTMIRASIPQVSSNNHIYSGGLFVNEQGLELLLREHPEWFEIREFNALLRHHVLRVLKDIDWQSTVRSGQGDSVCNWHEQKMDTDLIRVSYLEDSEETNVVEHSHEVQGMDETISEEKDMRNGGDQKPYTLRVRKRRLAHSVARSFVESPSKDLTSSAANRDSDNQEILSCAESAKRRRTRQLGAIRNCVTRRIPTCRQRIYQQQRSSVASVFRSTRSNRFRKNADPSIRFNGSRATVRKRASSPYGRRGRPASGRAASASSGSRRILMARVPLRRAASLTSSAASPEDTCGRRNLSVLQYPGGKTRAIPILMKFLPSAIYNQQQRFVMCSPFIGGASFELQCLEQFPNCFIYAYDKFEPLINFWQCLQMHRTALIKKIEALHPMTAAKFDVLRQRVTRLGAGNLARAAAFYALNRTSFNGMSCSSGFSRSNGKRFNRNPMIERLRGINLDRIVFAVADFEHAIAKHPSQFLFLDPPYALEPGDCHLYGEDGELHREFDHERLHRVLVACIQLHSSPLLLCYNSCKLIQELYGAPTEPAALVAASSRTRRVLRAGSPASRPQHPSSSQHRRDNSNVNFHLHRVSWKYGMSFGKAGRELAITNYPPALRST